MYYHIKIYIVVRAFVMNVNRLSKKPYNLTNFQINDLHVNFLSTW